MGLIKNVSIRIFCFSYPILIALLISLILAHPAYCAAGDILFSDDFDDGTLSPWTAYIDPDQVGVSNATSNSGEYSMYVRWGYDAGDSPAFNANVSAAELNVWIRRGGDAFSEDPDADEDLHIQYQDDSGNWQDLDVLAGDGTPGEIFTPTYILPSNARHENLRLGFLLDNGDGADYDYWHVDDVQVTERSLDSFCRSGAAIHDSFEDGNLDPWEAPQGQHDGITGVSQDTAAYGDYSAFVGEGSVTVESEQVKLNKVTSGNLSVWIRRGDDAFSEDPDSGEDLVLEYRAQQGNTWNELQTYSGEGDPGEIFTPSFSLPEDALHNNFKIRFRLTGGSGDGYDYWHFDNICLTTISGGRVDHYAVSHDGSAVSCAAEPITFTAHNAGHNPKDPGEVTIELEAINQDTNNGEGTWARVLDGTGSLNDPTAGDGSASYTFPGGESSVTLAFNYTEVTNATDPETVNFDVNGGNEGAGEDPDLIVSRSGFRITDGNGNPIDIPDQIAGKRTDQDPNSQTLGLQAIETSTDDPSQCVPAFPDGTEVEVELAAECRNPATCAGKQMRVINPSSNQTIATNDDNAGNGASSYTPVPLLFGTNAEASIQLKYNDAGKMQFHARYNPIKDGSGNPPVVEHITGSSKSFVVRPFGFQVNLPETNSNAIDANGTRFKKAGANFTVEATAKCWNSSDDSDIRDGIPDWHNDQDPTNNSDLSDNLNTPNFGNETDPEKVDLKLKAHLWKPNSTSASDPGLSGNTTISTFYSGSGNTTEAHYDEVGIIEINATIQDDSYLGISSSKTSKIIGSSGPVGRFIPAHFQASNASLNNRSHFSPDCADNFTYLDEQWSAYFDLTAKNLNNVTTYNYTNNYAKLDITDSTYNGTNATGLNFAAVHNPNNNTAYVPSKSLTDRMGIYNVAGNFTQGTANINLNGTIHKNSTGPDGPFHDFRLGFKPIDEDDVRLIGNPDLNSTLSNGNETYELVDGNIRYGRLSLENTYGSELLDLEVPIKAEYYNDDDVFTLNKDDWCTRLTIDNSTDFVRMELKNETVDWQSANQTIGLSGKQSSGSTRGKHLKSSTSEDLSLQLDAGKAFLVLDAPGANKTGYVHVQANLEDHPWPWLQYDWSGNGTYNESPNATATFGIYKGNEHIIYQQETTWK